jgi:hypothetical protein
MRPLVSKSVRRIRKWSNLSRETKCLPSSESGRNGDLEGNPFLWARQSFFKGAFIDLGNVSCTYNNHSIKRRISYFQECPRSTYIILIELFESVPISSDGGDRGFGSCQDKGQDGSSSETQGSFSSLQLPTRGSGNIPGQSYIERLSELFSERAIQSLTLLMRGSWR